MPLKMPRKIIVWPAARAIGSRSERVNLINKIRMGEKFFAWETMWCPVLDVPDFRPPRPCAGLTNFITRQYLCQLGQDRHAITNGGGWLQLY